MVAINRSSAKSSERLRVSSASNSSKLPVSFLKRSFSSKKFSRQFPFLAGIHRAADGALIGVLVAIGLMSTLTLHWQNLWTLAFSRLESTRDLAHRLTESTAIIERHYLQEATVPLSMVPTKAADLVYIDSPEYKIHHDKRVMGIELIKQLNAKIVDYGY